MSIRAAILIGSLFVVLSGGDAYSQKENKIIYLPVPVSEAVYTITRFFESYGYIVEQTEQNREKFSVNISKNDTETKKWSIVLTPNSPLRTKLETVIDSGIFPEKEFAQLVASLSKKSVDDTQSLSAESRSIPVPVLNQIGNVACIHVQTEERTVQFTGFFIDKEGLILSTAHDLREHDQVQIVTNTGIYYKGDIVKTDFNRDLALIKVDAVKEEIVYPAKGRNLLSMGESLFSIGCPGDLRGTVESGFVNGPPRKIKEIPLWQVHMRIQPGGSGSPVFDNNGMFVAVVKGRHREAEDIGFLIPLEVVIDFLKDYFSLCDTGDTR